MGDGGGKKLFFFSSPLTFRSLKQTHLLNMVDKREVELMGGISDVWIFSLEFRNWVCEI